MKNSFEIRDDYINFFISKSHKFIPSSPVIPNSDNTLLFTNAGMNQFKEIFLDKEAITYKRVVNSQKCIRVGGKHNDLEDVGVDDYHHTFFEMLGNWSFGDYYKKETIIWAWELLTEVWKIPKEKLYATVHNSDAESYIIWGKYTDIDKNHIEYHGDKDNFWEMANVGACGPCSEIHMDLGEERCNKKDDLQHHCKVNGNCHRFVELWNLVFIQFERNKEGKLFPLKNKFVDTGAGFERICQVLQNKNSNYETDLFMPIIKEIEKISKVAYHKNSVAHKVIADHIRCLVFALSDGGAFANDGRNYVLRRILRRASRLGRTIGLKKPFLYKLVDIVCFLMEEHYSELKSKKKYLKVLIEQEEKKFDSTLDKGLEIFNSMIKNLQKGDFLSGKDAFLLYDTYGFPLDLTKNLLKENNLQTKEEEFEEEMVRQRKRAKASSKFNLNIEKADWTKIFDLEKSEFLGYKKQEIKCKIAKYILAEDNEIKFILDKTPFYAESGGQIADIGYVCNSKCKINVYDVQKNKDFLVHLGKIKEGKVNDEEFTAIYNASNRKIISSNHTATHLLHKALKMVLGEHISQKGSLVSTQNLRFDFSHFKAMTAEQIKEVEDIVNEKIRECFPVKTEEKKLAEAKEDGAIALFSEKYKDEVRIVSIDDFSKELCGGTHVNYTGELGLFIILTESAIASGIRRIEALTGSLAFAYLKKMQAKEEKIADIFKTQTKDVLPKVEKLFLDSKKLAKENIFLKEEMEREKINYAFDKLKKLGEISYLFIEINNKQMLKFCADYVKSKLSKFSFILLYIKEEDKYNLASIVSKDLQEKFSANLLIQEICKKFNGSGGGKKDIAMGAIKNLVKIDLIEHFLLELIENL